MIKKVRALMKVFIALFVLLFLYSYISHIKINELRTEIYKLEAEITQVKDGVSESLVEIDGVKGQLKDVLKNIEEIKE